MRNLALLFLLGASAFAQDTQDTPPTPPTYTVQLPGGQSIQVSAPAATAHPDGGWNTWKLQDRRTSFDQRFTALLFLREQAFVKDHTAETHLVKPDGQLLNLPLGAVYSLHWTADGQYLVGEGGNTLRLWNTNGKLRTKALPSGMDAVSVNGSVVCVANYDFNDAKTAQVQRLRAPNLTSIGRYRLNYEPKSGERFCK